MANKRANPEVIVSKLRQVEVLVSQGMPRVGAIRQLGVAEQTDVKLVRNAHPALGKRSYPSDQICNDECLKFSTRQ